MISCRERVRRRIMVEVENAANLMLGEDTDESFDKLAIFQQDILNTISFDYSIIFLDKIENVDDQRKMDYVRLILLHYNTYLEYNTLTDDDFDDNELIALDYLVQTQNLNLSRFFLVCSRQDMRGGGDIPPEIGNNLIYRHATRLGLHSLLAKLMENNRFSASVARIRN